MSFGDPAHILEHHLCGRCQDLNILEFLNKDLPWELTSELNARAQKGTNTFQSLGKTGSTEFWNDCALCLCLFALTPNPSSPDQDIFLLTDWSMNRLAGETDTITDLDGWGQFPKCLLITLSDDDSSIQQQFSTQLHRGDALCVVQEDDPSHCLAGRIIDPKALNINIIQDWLRTCDNLHTFKCSPSWTQEIPDLKLVEVTTRTIVKPPTHSFQYLALSYVWGGVHQHAYQLGSKLADLPAVIDDAIHFTRLLGKQYLWVDSLCIDQSNEEDKERQISKMQDIYSGSYVTIIALSGTSANTGLPRFNSNREYFSQLTCRINGKLLVGLMPTLSQQIWRSPWGQRAWTLQEALLSPRCVYISEHQLYFECNGMQACESLDDTKSWAHHLPLSSKLPSQGGWLASKVGDGCLRVPIDNPSHRMERYGSKLTLYSYRSMSHASDGLNAFSGILQFLKSMYTKGFYFGLPVEDFQWGLLWCSQYPPTRRSGFPSWSWAGWEGGLWPAYPIDYTKPHQYPLHIWIWSLVGRGELTPVFMSSHRDVFPNDPIAKAVSREPEAVQFDLNKYPNAVKDGYLLIEAIVFRFAPDYSQPHNYAPQSGHYAMFNFALGGVRCILRIMSIDSELEEHLDLEEQDFILLARDQTHGFVIHHLLLVRFDGDVATRGTVLELLVPESHLVVLKECGPVKRRLVLT